MHGVDHALMILGDEQLAERHRSVADGVADLVVDEHATGAERAQRHEALVGLAREVRPRRIAHVEQDLRYLIEVGLHLWVFFQVLIDHPQLVPALGARRQH